MTVYNKSALNISNIIWLSPSGLPVETERMDINIWSIAEEWKVLMIGALDTHWNHVENRQDY